jgi:hypothetical protein
MQLLLSSGDWHDTAGEAATGEDSCMLLLSSGMGTLGVRVRCR